MNITLSIIVGYLCLLLILGLSSNRLFKGTAKDYFLASHSIGPFMLLMSVFGTTMTAFALVGSTAKSYTDGIGVFGLLASWAGLLHSATFFIIGIKMWSIGRRMGYTTQCQFFRDRFQSNGIGYLLFPTLVGLVVPYLLIGLLGAGRTIGGLTAGAYPDVFEGGAIPHWLTAGVICLVVLAYVFFGGLRGAVWANTFQTLVFMFMGVLAFFLIADNLGGLVAATEKVMETSPKHLQREGMMSGAKWISYALIPISAGMFPHLFQHWLTARDANAFKLTVVAHPLCVMIVWAPCVLVGVWAVGAGIDLPPAKAGAVLGIMVKQLQSPILTGLITAGILAAIMSSLDSQFMALGTMFTNDIVFHHFGKDRFSNEQKVWMARGFIFAVVALTYTLSLANPKKVFELAIWCFSGFTALLPIVVGALYWRRATKAGAYACVITTVGLGWFFFARADYGATEGLVYGMLPVTFMALASSLAFIGVSLVTKPPGEDTLVRFFPKKGGGS